MMSSISSNSGFFSWLQRQTSKRLVSGKKRFSLAGTLIAETYYEFQRRRKLRKLLDQSDDMLLDIGFSRIQLCEALNYPWSTNATKELQKTRSSLKNFDTNQT
ncbi:MAG: hypothetical protein WBC71_04300 [Salaquimonas sp.]